MSLWFRSLANADVSFSGASLFRCFILDLFVYMELSWMLLDGSTVSSWYKARPETLNLLWILMGIMQKRWRFSRESDPFLEVWSMLQYCGVLLLKVFLLFSKEILPKCNCHIWGNYENSKIQSLSKSLLIECEVPPVMYAPVHTFKGERCSMVL